MYRTEIDAVKEALMTLLVDEGQNLATVDTRVVVEIIPSDSRVFWDVVIGLLREQGYVVSMDGPSLVVEIPSQ